MDKWDVTLAQLFKDRNNPKAQGISLGKVISGLPSLSVSLGDEIILDTEDLVIANRLYHLPTVLTAGDYVILVPAPNGQTYYALDKAGE